MIKRREVCNFNAGPSAIFTNVLEEAQNELLNYKDTGISILEMSHRSKEYKDINDKSIQLIRKLYNVPEEFEIMFIQGGATLQFSMIPMCFIQHNKMKGGYVNSGIWAKKAYEDGKFYGDIYKSWDGEEYNFTRMPNPEEIDIKDNTAYLYITANETINGIRIIDWPNIDIPIISDMSSDFMSRSIQWEKFGMIYGGAQKGFGSAGTTVVIINKKFLENINKNIGSYFRYDMHIQNKSILNTPPIFSIYMMSKILNYIDVNGGLEFTKNNAVRKSKLLYDVIDNSDNYYHSPVYKQHRSLVNVIFKLNSKELEEKFIFEAKKNNFIGIDGHRSIGGCRINCYSAVLIEWVEKLCDFMLKFKNKN